MTTRGGAVVNIVASQQESLAFHMFSLCLRGLPLGTPLSRVYPSFAQ